MRTEPLPTAPRGPWWESSFALALVGALAIHAILGLVASQWSPPPPDPAPVEVVEVEIAPASRPPPPAAPAAMPPPPAPAPPPVAPASAPHHVATPAPPRAAEPPPATRPSPAEPPPTPSPAAPTSPEGGAPVVAMPDVAPAATGVPVAKGPVAPHVGRGGRGTGTGSGTGSGAGELPAMSVATIKTRAMPRGDYAYEESKDYPAEARRLGIEGKIRVKLIVDATGAVTSAQLLNKLGHGLDELAFARATRIAFDPAKDTDDRPVASVVVWTFNLALPK